MMKGQTSKYLKYAIGEIILVVIGILIALQINNWNEARKRHIAERSILSKFLEDLESDATFFQSNLTTIEEINQLHKDLYQRSFKNNQSIVLKKPAFIRRALIYNPIAKDNAPNIINDINEDALREEVQVYFRLMSDVQEGKNEHEDIVLEIRAFLRELKVHRLKPWFESSMVMDKESTLNEEIITSNDLMALSDNTAFQQLLLESSIKTNDVKKALLVLIESNTKLVANIHSYIND